MKKPKSSEPASAPSEEEIRRVRRELEASPDIEEAAQVFNLAGNSTRLKILYLLDREPEYCVSDLAELLGVSVSAVSQHLAKLRDHGLVKRRREAQTIYYRLTEVRDKERLFMLMGPHGPGGGGGE